MARNRFKRIKEIDRAFGSDLNNCFIFPGFTDVHVHLREPGFLYKETIATGTKAAAAGGFTNIVTMPNLKPCPDSLENLQVQLDAIEEKAIVNVIPTAAISVGEEGEKLSDIEKLAGSVVGFTDDGRGVMSDELMREAMIRAGKAGLPIIAHCEDENYPRDSHEAEYMQLKRDLKLVRETGCRYHACHISTKESVELIREAKKEGLPVTCETAPHYLVLDREAIREAAAKDDGGRFKMNPPIKEAEDRAALIEAIKDGTVDMIATDHAPHSLEEKSKGFEGSAYGVVGLETAFPVLYTELVLKDVISLDRLIELMSIRPAEIFGIGKVSRTSEEALESGDYTVWNLEDEYTIDPETFLSKGKSSPFEGMRVKGRSMMTAVEGKAVWQRDRLQHSMKVLENRKISEGFYLLKLTGEHGITRPGQFINIRVPGFYLRRPLSVCDYNDSEVTVVYKIVGGGTEKLSSLIPGDRLDVLSPLGNGFELRERKPVLIGGGAGVATMYGLCRKLADAGHRPVVIGGFRKSDEIFLREEFEEAGGELHVSTEDGSEGEKGFVTDVMKRLTEDGIISGDCEYYVCGPEAMLKAVDGAVPEEAGGQFSFEERMGCGFGACMGCSCRTRYGNKRICREGPVLDRKEIVW